MSALRKRYLEAVLKQDVGFYDTDARTGDIVFVISMYEYECEYMKDEAFGFWVVKI